MTFVKTSAIASALGSLASLLLGLAIPIAFPQVDPWFGNVGIALAGVLFLTAIAIFLWPQQSNERQRQLFVDLAEALARLQDIALGFPKGTSWPANLIERRWNEWNEAHENARRLIGEICYDESTSKTADDFRQICAFIIDDASHGEDSEEHRSEIHAMKAPLFRSLHEGRSVNRKKMPLPGWVRKNDQRTSCAPTAATKSESAPPNRADWLTLSEVLKYLVEESEWSYSLKLNPGDKPEEILTAELFDAAARGDIEVRGYRKVSEHPFRLAAASEQIPSDFWIYAFMQPFFEIYHAGASGHKDPSRPAVAQRCAFYPEAPGGFMAA